MPDPKTTELGLRSGDLDFASLPPSQAEALRTAAGLKVEQQPGIANVWLGLNVEKPPFNDPRCGRRSGWRWTWTRCCWPGYNGRAPRANALIMPQVVGYWPDAPAPKRNVAEAKRLLAESGHAAGFKAASWCRTSRSIQTMALVAQALLRDVGITLEVDAQDAASFFSAGKGETGKALDLFIIRFNGKLDPNFLAQWFTTGADRHLELAALEQPGVRPPAGPGQRGAGRRQARGAVHPGAEADGGQRRLRLADLRRRHLHPPGLADARRCCRAG